MITSGVIFRQKLLKEDPGYLFLRGVWRPAEVRAEALASIVPYWQRVHLGWVGGIGW